MKVDIEDSPDWSDMSDDELDKARELTRQMKREEALAKPNNLSIEEAFHKVFEKYKEAFRELSDK